MSQQLDILENLEQLTNELNIIRQNVKSYNMAQALEKKTWLEENHQDVKNSIVLLNDISDVFGSLHNLVLDQFVTKKKEEDDKEQAKKVAQQKALASGCKTIDELCGKVDNPNQVTILNRIITDKEYSKIYLSGYDPNTDFTGKKKNLIGTVNVLGTFNEKKQCREEYEIKLYKEDPKGMFWCSCADHKFNSTKKNIVCKHICFLICKIGKFLKPDVFTNKKLSDEDLAGLLAKLQSSGDIWKDQTIAKILDKITLDTFKQFLKAIDDCCPVCFNDLTDADKPDLLACPTCKNYIHSECADIWLEQRACCALCKSDYWKYYGKVKSGGSVNVKNTV